MEIKWRKEFYDWQPIAKAEFFESEEYIALNNNIQLTKYDPKTIEENPPLFSVNLQNLFPGFKIYQFTQTSKFRPFPLRIVYSKIHGKVFELKGSNEPIYDLLRYLKYADLLSDSWVYTNLYNYVIFFFDNVTGKHGRFELIDIRNKRVSPLEQVTDRVNNFFRLPFQINSDIKEDLIEKEYKTKFKDYLKQGESIENVYIAIKKEIENFFSDQNVNDSETKIDLENSSEAKIENLHMIFQNSLYKADVSISLKKENFGNIILKNECLYNLLFSRNSDDEIVAKIKMYEADDIKNGSVTNLDQKDSSLFITEQFPML